MNLIQNLMQRGKIDKVPSGVMDSIRNQQLQDIDVSEYNKNLLYGNKSPIQVSQNYKPSGSKFLESEAGYSDLVKKAKAGDQSALEELKKIGVPKSILDKAKSGDNTAVNLLQGLPEGVSKQNLDLGRGPGYAQQKETGMYEDFNQKFSPFYRAQKQVYDWRFNK